MSQNNKTLDKFAKTAIEDLKYTKIVEGWSHKDLADFMIQNIWGDEKFNKWGTLKCAVLDRVINELFKLDEESKKYPKPRTLNGLQKVIKSIQKDRKNV